MKPKLLIIYLTLVLLPISMLAWVGFRLARSEAAQVEESVTKLYLSRLHDYDGTIQKVLDTRSRRILDLSTEVSPGFPALELRGRTSREPFLKQLFVLDTDGRLEYPNPATELSDNERDFLIRTSRIWTGGLIPSSIAGNKANVQKIPQGKNLPEDPSQVQQARKPSSSGYPNNVPQPEPIISGAGNGGWITWYWESGVHLLYWVRMTDGRVIGGEFDRASLMADMISELPLTNPFGNSDVVERVQLINASDQLVYQWGLFQPPEEAGAAAEISLSPPLSSWKLRYFPGNDAPTADFTKSRLFTLGITLFVLVAVFLFVAVYAYREHSRDLREAATRVSFVNRVSHELKTPLTNIRMYSELLANQIDEDDIKSHERLAIITSESERLTRLISNVLTFSKRDGNNLSICRKPNSVDDIIGLVTERFTLAFKSAGISVVTKLDAAKKVNLDSDALEQILTNLLSNVEKYAAAGGIAEISTSLEGDTATVIVSDKGPGIPASLADSVFKPFYRLTDSLNEGTSGTGIGLGIARELARMHGGDVCLGPSESGASFIVTLNVGDGEL